jgi:septum formation protein
MRNSQKLILASSSPRRLALLQSIAVQPDEIISPDINEASLPKEKPEVLALRLSEAKALAVAVKCKEDAFILGADTIVSTKTKIFDKAESAADVEKYLNIFSGRKINIHTAVAVVKVQDGIITKTAKKLVTSHIKFKRLSHEELKHYVASNNGIGAAGGFAIQSIGETLLQWMRGSYSGIVGLPLCETVNLLKGLRYDVIKSKSED